MSVISNQVEMKFISASLIASSFKLIIRMVAIFASF